MKFRKLPVVIDAVRWWPEGQNHDRVYFLESSGKKDHCLKCGYILDNHGWINTLEGRHIVCPGDWIIKGVKGEYYPVKNDIFEMTYEPVEEDEHV